jgi:transcriptional regulator with XRE-family HTH domain
MIILEEQLYKLIGAKIRIARQAAELSQEDLANRIGLGRTSITNIEIGRQKLQIFTLYLIAETLRITVQSLLPDPDTSPKDIQNLLNQQKVVDADGKEVDLNREDKEYVLKLLKRQ